MTALSTGTGELLWTFDFPTEVDINGGLKVANGVVYTSTTHGEIFAIRASTGEQLWRVSDPAVTFATSAPEVANGVVFVTSGHGKQDNGNHVLYAFEAGTGRALWQHSLGAALASFASTDSAGVVFAVTVRDLKCIAARARAC